MSVTFHIRALALSIILAPVLGTASHATAQAIPAFNRGSELSPFAQGTLITPDFGPTNNYGFTAGIDYTRFFRSAIQPSLELRYTIANGTTVNEKAVLGGIKLQTRVHNIYPFATLLAGKGYIDFNFFNNGYNHDNALIYAIGGGAEFKLNRLWKVRAEYLYQNWNLDPNSLTPAAVSVGIGYTLPFALHGER